MTQSQINNTTWWPPDIPEVRKALQTAATDGSWGRYHGPHCDTLTAALQEHHGVAHAWLCCSGTAGIELALRAIPVKPGDEVILCAYDFKALFSTVVLLGATPVLIDTLPNTPAPDLNQMKSAISPATKAVMLSHLHGFEAGIQQAKSICNEHNIALIEDACQFPGVWVGNQRAGSIGDLGILSFGGSKLLTAGRGGAVLTNDSQLLQRIKLYSQRGNLAYPMSELQAAILLPQLQQLDDFHRRRRAGLTKLISFLTAATKRQLVLPQNTHPNNNQSEIGSANGSIPPDKIEAAFYKIALLCPQERSREKICAAAQQLGVALFPAFPALNRIHSARRFRSIGNLEHANQLHEKLMVLHHPLLIQSETTLMKAAEILNSVFT